MTDELCLGCCFAFIAKEVQFSSVFFKQERVNKKGTKILKQKHFDLHPPLGEEIS